jgi:hypothetical protein
VKVIQAINEQIRKKEAPQQAKPVATSPVKPAIEVSQKRISKEEKKIEVITQKDNAKTENSPQSPFELASQLVPA